MLRFGLLFSLLFIQGIPGLHYYIEDAYFKTVDNVYFENATTKLEPVWVNLTESGITTNITLLKKLSDTATGHFNIFLKTMGEYKTHSGVTANLPWCTVLTDPVLFQSFTKAVGMQDTECPPPPGVYGTTFWQPSTELLPDSLPSIDYKITFSIRDKGSNLLVAWIYVSSYA